MISSQPGSEPQPPKTSRRWELAALGVVLLGGLFLRVAYLRELEQTPSFDLPVLDPGFHDYWARGLVTGNWTPPKGEADPLIRTTPYLRPPGYPYFLAGVYKFFGLSYWAPRIAQAVLGLLNCVLAFTLVRRWFGAACALVAAAFMASYWIFIYFEGSFQDPVLLVFLLLAFATVAATWVDRRAFARAFAAGLLLGLAVLVRPNALVIAPVVLAWAWWVAWRRRERAGCYAKAAIGLAAGCAIAVAPATIRNYRVAGDFVMVSANGGINLFIGNQAMVDGVFYNVIPGFGRFATCYDYPQIVKSVEKEQGRPLKYSEVSAYFAAKAWQFIREQPGRFAVLVLRRALLFWGPREIAHNEVIDCERSFSGTLNRIPGSFPIVLSLCWIGLLRLIWDYRSEGRADDATAARCARKMEVSVLLAALVFGYFLSFLLFFNTALYRVPLIPFLMIFAAYGVWRIGQSLWRWEFRRAMEWIVGWGLCAVIATTSVVPYASPGPAAWHCDRGKRYAYKGQTALAIVEGEAALKADARNIEAHALMGMWLERQGRYKEAARHHETARELSNMRARLPGAE